MKARYGIPALVALVVAGTAHASDPALGHGAANPVVVEAGRTGDVVTFESLMLPPGTQIDPPDGVATTVDGYTFTPGPNNASGLNDSHFGNAVNFWPYNGTHVALFHDDVVITKDGGGSFDFVQFDFAGWVGGYEVPFTVTAQPGNTVANFTPDGLCDGPGGAVDFETFTLPSGFEGVTSVTIEHSGAGTVSGIFAIDDLVMGKPLPVEAKSWGEVKSDYRK